MLLDTPRARRALRYAWQAAAEINDVADVVRDELRQVRPSRARWAARHLNVPFVGWPTCAVCQQPVEDMRAQAEGPELVITAHCHDDTEVVRVHELELRQAGPFELNGQCFDAPALEPHP